MTIEEAKAAAERVIRNSAGDVGTTVKIYLWPTRNRHRAVGLRVAEISFTKKAATGIAGTSLTQVDADSLGACAAAERYMIAILEEWPDEEKAYAKRLLEDLVRP